MDSPGPFDVDQSGGPIPCRNSGGCARAAECHVTYQHYLQRLFAPASVAVVGASDRDGSLGREVLHNILAGSFRGRLHLVNPAHDRVMDRPCHATLTAIGSAVDLAVLAMPARALPSVLADAERAGVRHAIVLGDADGPGEEELRLLARRRRVRLIGPRSLGIMRPALGLNATFGRTAARPGAIALISQSGAVCSALVDWAWSAGFGFSSVVSVGAALDVDIGEVLDYLEYDQDTRSILLYLEGVRGARTFVSGLRACARAKPIVVMKAGRHLSGHHTARSHTGMLIGSDAVFDAVLRRCGAVRVRTYNELFSAARLLAAERTPAGNRLGIVSVGGGPGVVAADACADRGVQLASAGDRLLGALAARLPEVPRPGNPLVLRADAGAGRMAAALGAFLDDEAVDGVLTLYCPLSTASAEETARALLPVVQKARKPVLTAWLGEHEAGAGRALIETAGMPAFSSAESGVNAFGALAEYHRAQALLLEVPPPLTCEVHPDLAGAQAILERALSRGRTLLTEPEAKRLLGCFAIPTTRILEAADAEAAVRAAADIGFPVALKVLSADIPHKSEVDGVRLNIRNAAALREEYDGLMARARQLRPDARLDGVAVQSMVHKRYGRELMIGIVRDPVFGPVLSVGSGGIAVELLQDSAVGLPPLSASLAQAMIDSTRMARLLAGYRHIPPADRGAVVDVLLRISDMAVSLPWISELDINPLVADHDGAVALDARVVIDPTLPALDRRYSHMAVHPYPTRLEHSETLADGTRMQIRPIRPEDARMEMAFVSSLSEHSRYMRFFSSANRLSPRLLARFTQVDYDRELALIAVEGEGDTQSIAGVARFAPLPDHESCEFAVTVADRHQGHGLGHRLMSSIIKAARDAGYTRMTGQILAANMPMLSLARSLGFRTSSSPDDPAVVDAELDLTADQAAT